MNVRIFIENKTGYKILTNIYLFCMLSLFLFYYQDYYFDMTNAKYRFFAFVSGCYVGACLLLYIFQYLSSKKTCVSLPAIIKNLSVTDWGFLCFLCSHILSTFVSVHSMESLDGSSGRYLGLYFSFLITILYFLISRFHQPDHSMLIFFISMSIAISLGVINFFGFDPLGFFERIAAYDIPRFLSTIGNISFFADAICLSLPFTITMYCLQENKRYRLCALIFALFGFVGIFICNADGGYIGIGMFLFLFMMYITRFYEGMKRFLRLMIYALGIGQVFHLLTLLFPDATRGFTTLSYLFTSSPFALILLVIFVLLYAGYSLYPRFQEQAYRHNVSKAIFIFGSVCIFFFLLCFLYFSIFDTTTDLKEFASYLRYNDAWGTGRGLIWNRLVPVYVQDFTWFHKAFGYGLDCTRLVFTDYFYDPNLMLYDNAHNEYLQYLITSGFFGLLSYGWLFFSIQYRLWKHRNYNLYGFALAGCFLAHGFQAIVGLTQPFSTPLLFILIAMAEASLRLSHKCKRKSMSV